MAHNPLNHPLRPFYRALAGLAAIALIVFGIVGATQGGELFALHGSRAFGLGVNLFSSIVLVIVGALALIGVVIGRNLDEKLDKYLGWGLLVVGSYGLATSRTDANFLGFTIGTVTFVYVIGMLLVLSGLYAKVAPVEEAGAPRQEREAAVH
jgi:hypothetical protein